MNAPHQFRAGDPAAVGFYKVPFGPLGPVMDLLVVHQHLSSAWNDGMEGLRRHLEHQANAQRLEDRGDDVVIG